jgi:hypothetical protein
VTLNQLAIAANADLKWLLNSSSLLGRKLRPTAKEARWWGLVRALESTFGLTLANASAGATRALAHESDDGEVVVAENSSSSATMSVNVFRYDSTALGNLSRALVRETPMRRGRRAGAPHDPIGAGVEYGLDIGLLRSSLERTPAERLALLDRNQAFVYEMQRKRRKS